jgi:hypothetical protein
MPLYFKYISKTSKTTPIQLTESQLIVFTAYFNSEELLFLCGYVEQT